MSRARSTLKRLQQENQALKESQGQAGVGGLRTNGKKNLENLSQEEEEEEEEEEDIVEEEEMPPQNVHVGKRGPPCVSLSSERGKRQRTRPPSSHHHQPDTVTNCTFKEELSRAELWVTYNPPQKCYEAYDVRFLLLTHLKVFLNKRT